MQMTPAPFWLMIASSTTAVLPVWRSPITSSRCPRPIGTIASIALRPVCSGSLTGWRATTPGAVRSTSPKAVVLIGPLPSIGWPSAFTTRTDERVADRHRHDACGALDGVALADLLRLAEQHRADRVLLEVERQAHDAVRQLQELPRHAALEAADARDAVAHAQHAAHLGDVDIGLEAPELLAKILVISSARISMLRPSWFFR
jgi:hypothetical protein